MSNINQEAIDSLLESFYRNRTEEETCAFREHLFEGKKKSGYICYGEWVDGKMKLVFESYDRQKHYVYLDEEYNPRFEDTGELVPLKNE